MQRKSNCHTDMFQRKARESRRTWELVERGTHSIVFVYLTLFYFCCSFVIFRQKNLCLQIVFFSAFPQAATVKSSWDHKGQHKEIMELKGFFVSQSMWCWHWVHQTTKAWRARSKCWWCLQEMKLLAVQPFAGWVCLLAQGTSGSAGTGSIAVAALQQSQQWAANGAVPSISRGPWQCLFEGAAPPAHVCMTRCLCILCLDMFLVNMLKVRSKKRLLLVQETMESSMESSMERLSRDAIGMLALVALLSSCSFEASWQWGNVQDKLCGHFSVCQLHR